MHRHKMSAQHSKRLFTATAGARHVHTKNISHGVMRGGIRL